MMSIIVSKFGGSSMADAVMFQKVREIIQNKRRPHYIILSAPGKRCGLDDKITDLLCRAHCIFASGGNPADLIQKIKGRFADIISTLKIDMDPNSLMESLEEDIRHSRDRAASRGEYLCAKIFAVYASLPFVDATELIHFDADGRILPDQIRASVREMAARLPYAVIPGFYGSKPSGEIMTFTRGGSDITGALVAAALHATVYENWTDVDGLMSIDPRICPDAVHHASVSYRQMRMLAKAGAQVLHPYCLEPVCEAGIPTVLRNTFFPDRPGTYISDCVRQQVPCICIKDDFRALPLNTASSETVEILENLSPDFYLAEDGSRILRLRACRIGMPASCISIFGLPAAQHREAASLVKHLGVLTDEGALRILVATDNRDAAAQALHRYLIEHA